MSVTKEQAVRFLSNVPPENNFWCNDGKILANLGELQQALATMSKDTFKYHVNAEKSDFSTWVKDIIGDEYLAHELRKSKDSKNAAKIVAKRIEYLKGIAA
jgi:hypothetical protein